jgi:anti-anti-sigma factor
MSSLCGMISGWQDKGLRLLRDKADGGSAIKSDPTISETARRNRSGDRPVLVKLSEQLDVRYRKALEDILSDCLASGRPTLVDLSEVTFMDSRCVRELTVHYQLGKGCVALCDPSQEVELSVAACDLEGWIDFVYTTDTSGDPPSCAAASVFHSSAMKIEERNLLVRTPYTAVSRKEPGSSWTFEEYAGYTVCDPQGHKIGRAEKLFLNGRGEPEYIRVKAGLFGFKTILIPVQTVTADEERRALVLQ